MIIDSTSRKYQLVLTTAKTTDNMSIVVNWEPVSKMPNLTPKLERTSSNGVTAVDILATTDLPKRITSLTIYNADTAPKTVQVFLNDTGTAFLIISATLQPGEMLGYSESTQWYTGGATGPWALLAGNSSQVFSVAPSTAATHALQASQKPGFPINFNGNMQIAQAGTSFAAPASGAYDIDGWINGNTSAAVFTVAQVAGSIAGKYARQVEITTADAAVAAGDAVLNFHRIEGYDIAKLVGKDFTVSFRAKFPVTGIHCLSLRNTALDRSYVHEINCLSADTYTEYSFTVVGGLPTGGTWVYANTTGMHFSLIHMAGTTYTGTPATADTWMTGNYITTANQVNDCATIGNQWALEDFRIDLGTVKGTEWPSYQENLARCQMYAKKYTGVFIGLAQSSNTLYSSLSFARMRSSPTIAAGATFTASTGNAGTPALGGSATVDAIQLYNSGAAWTANALIYFTGLLEARL